MIYEFDYAGSVEHLTDEERDAFAKDLDDAMPGGKHGGCDGFNIDRKEFCCWGWYDDDDDNPDYASGISRVLVKYDIDWQGGTEEYEPEPDWGKMTGGIDDY